MRFGNRCDARDVSRLRLDATLADRNVHVRSVPLEQFHGAESGQVANRLRLERVSVVALEVARHQSVFEAARVIPLGFDDLASQFDPFEAFAGESVDVDGA